LIAQFNTVGNREMYQNCVNVDIEGGSGEGKFPPLFVANLASVNSVVTTENSDVLFPEPGEFVTTMSATDGYNFPKATVGAAQGGQGAPSSYAAPSATSAPAYSAPAASSAPAYSAPPNVQSGIESYDNQKGLETQTTFATSYATKSSAAASAPNVKAPAPTGNASSGGSSGSGQCTTDGAVVCNGPKQFGLCNRGSVVWQPVADGMACSGGVVSGAQRFRRHVHGAHKH
jgi:hypothetical protein